MRVDNGIFVWRGLTGEKVAEFPSEELYEAQWRLGVCFRGGRRLLSAKAPYGQQQSKSYCWYAWQSQMGS